MTITLLLGPSSSYVYASEVIANSRVVTEHEAQCLAIACVWDARIATENVFDEDIKILDSFKMYNDSLDISAYVVNFEDANGNPKGYVIVGGTSDYPEIIEFSDSGVSPYEEEYLVAKELCEEDLYLYFDGNIEPQFIDKEAKDLVEIRDGKIEKRELRRDKEESSQKNVWARKQKAQMVEQVLVASGEGSPLGDGDFYISDPGAYELEAIPSVQSIVPSFYKEYLVTSDFTGYTNHCGPTAATNLMLYWAGRDDAYQNLMLDDDTWQATFKALHAMMFDAEDETTYIGEMATELKNFFKLYGHDMSVSYVLALLMSVNQLKAEIDADCPPIILVNGHNKYGDHYALAIGYIIYLRNDGTQTTYIRLADGHSSSPNRFINYNEGYQLFGGLSMIKVRPQ